MDFLKIISTVAGGNVGNSLGNLKNLLANQIGAAQGNKPASTITDSAIAELSLLFQSLYGALVEKGVITNEDFKRKFDELDMKDGVKDGK